MSELLTHASHLGVSVHVAHLPAPYRGFYDHRNARVVYDFNLTPIERRSVIAHELGHAYHGHTGHGVQSQEDAADRYAACASSRFGPRPRGRPARIAPWSRWALGG